MIRAIDLLNECADRLSWPQITTLDTAIMSTQQRKLLRLLVRVLKTWGGLDNWPLLRAEGTIVLLAEVVGDADLSEFVTATQNSDQITIDNVSLDDTYVERAIQVSSDDYVYRIKKVLTPTTLQLNRAWISDSITAADERTFTIAQDRYALPEDFDRPCESFESMFSPYSINPTSPNEFRRMRREWNGIHTDEPSHYTVYGTNPGTTVELVHFEPYPKSTRLLQFDYQRQHPDIDSDNDVVLVHQRYAEALITMIVHLAERDFEDDQKEQSLLLQMLREYNQQASRPELTRQRLILRPENQTRSDIRSAAWGGGTRMDWGSHFDNVSFVDLP